jgi:adenylate cyclase
MHPRKPRVPGLPLADPLETKRRLAAIFAADVEGYSRLMGADEVATLEALTARREILDGLIASHGGRIANTAGDSVLAEFGSAVDAVRCAMEAQGALAEANSTLPETRHINFRIGVHVGDVMVRAGDLFGDGVNIAARLQTLARAGGLCVSGVTYDQVRKILPLEFTDLYPLAPRITPKDIKLARISQRLVGGNQTASRVIAVRNRPGLGTTAGVRLAGSRVRKLKSETGQSRHSDDVRVTSAYPPRAAV